MKPLPKSTRQDLRLFFEELYPRLSELATGQSDHPSMDLRFLLSLYVDAVGAMTDKKLKYLYHSTVKDIETDRSRLARELLKIFDHLFSARLSEQHVRESDRRETFGQNRSTVPDSKLADAWNVPDMNGLRFIDRARRLAERGYGNATAIERRARRMNRRGFSMPGAISCGKKTSAQKA